MHIDSFLRTLFAISVVCLFAFGSAALAQGFELQFENAGTSGANAGDAGNTFKSVLSNATTSRVLPTEPPQWQTRTNGSGEASQPPVTTGSTVASQARATTSPNSSLQAPSSTSSRPAPRAQGATNGTIASQASDATYVTGLNTAGTVRVNNLANMECTMNVMSNGMEVLGIAWGGPTIIMAFMQMSAGAQDGYKRVINGCLAVLGGLAQPAWNNWLIACMRDCNLN
jgi:hypothetical protein